MELEEHLIELGVAANKWQAKHIVRGLQLDNLPTAEAKIERAKLYRAHRNLGESSADARAKAIAGVKPRDCPACEGEGHMGVHGLDPAPCSMCNGTGTKNFRIVESVERISPERKKQIMRELGDFDV